MSMPETYEECDNVKGQAKSWHAVVDALNEALPEWHQLTRRGVDSAVAAIKLLGARHAGQTGDPDGAWFTSIGFKTEWDTGNTVRMSYGDIETLYVEVTLNSAVEPASTITVRVYGPTVFIKLDQPTKNQILQVLRLF